MFDQVSEPASISGYAPVPDADLVKLVQSGNQLAFAELVKRYTGSIQMLATRTLYSKSDAEDIVQTVLLKFWQKPYSWNSEKSSLSTWLYKVTLNACYDASRSRTRRTELERSGESEFMQPDVLDNLSDDEEVRVRNKLLLEGMKSLPHAQKDAINLAIFVGLPQKDVASILGVSVKAVESLLIRAKAKLRKYVNDESGGSLDEYK